MILSTAFFVIYTLLCFLFVLAFILLALSKYQRRQSGLPKGEIVYEDVSGLAKEPIYSQRTSLSGKPDYLAEQIGQRAKLRFHVHPHMLRHSTGYYPANRGYDTRLVQDYLGH